MELVLRIEIAIAAIILLSVASGQNILVATGNHDGSYLDDVEVIDSSTVTSCPNSPTDFPYAKEQAVVVKHNSKTVICGGYPLTSSCRSFSNNVWSLEPFKLEPSRYGATAVEIREGEWLIMGGYAGSNVYLRGTELLKNGVFKSGPDLPESMEGGSAVMYNATHLFVAPGRRDSANHSPRNYFLNIDTDEWTQVADRTLDDYEYHSSGTFYNSSAGEIQIANTGLHGIEVYSPRDDAWHTGIQSPVQYLYKSVAIQQGPDSFILIGGQTGASGNTGNIFNFDENGLSTLKVNALSLSRKYHVAIPISTSDFACN